jgi:hypothetical protein
VYVGYPENADGSPDDKTFLLSLEVVGTERMKALEDAATLDSLVSALRLLPDSARVVVRRLTWDYIWEILPTTQVVFDATSHDAANDPAALARALREAAAPLQSQWARMQPELVLGETAAPRSHRLSERLAPLLPAYHALSEIPIVIETGGDGDDDASVAVDVAAGAWPPPSETWNAAEDSLFRWNGSSVKPRILPLALNEGAAEYFGSDWDALEEMVLRDALLTNYLPSIRNLGPGYGYLVYVGGESFLRYLGRTYGDESVALLLQSLYLGQRLSEGAVAIFGKDLDDLSDEWHEDLRRAVFPEYDETEGTEDWADEISDGPYDTFPRVHGDRMVYKRARRGRTELVLRDARNEHVIVSDRRPGAESLHLLEGAQDVRDSILAFAVQKKGRDVLRVASASGSNIGATIAEHGWDGILSITGLSIAPDCRRVALTAMNSRGHADLYVASLDGGALSQITDDIYEEASPCWGARGIVFSSDRASKDSHDLFLHEPDVAPRDPEESAPQGDGGIVQLTDTPWNETEPSWLEESGRLLVLDDREGRRNIYFVDPVTGASGAITRDRVGIVHADTDGEHVVASVLSGLQMTTWEAPLDRLLEAASVPLVAQASGDTTATSAPSIANELPHASDDAAPVTSELPPPQPLVGLAIRPGLSHSEWQPAPPPEHAQVPYRPRYGADVLLVNATSVASGAYLGISDLLGNRQLAFILGSSGGGADNFFRFLNVGAIYSNLEGRYDWRVGLVRSANDVLTEEQGFFFERNTGALFGMTYPIDRFRSVSWTLAGSIVEHEPIGEPKDTFGEVSAQTVLGHDTTVSDEYGYGYGNGLLTSLLLTVDYRVTKPAGWGSFTGLYDLRYYFPLVGRVFVATRASYGLSTGQVPQRIRLGGSWTLRGFGFNDLQGDRFALGNAELRFPLPVLAQVGPFPLIRAVQGALFADVGDAWFEGHHAHPNAALGFGFRTGFAGTVIRYDVSWLYSEQRGGWRDGVNGDLFLGYNF